MDGLGPLALMYGWQALLCATACVGVTQLVKTVLDLMMGKDARKANKWVTRLVLPLIPVFVGAIYAAVVPLRPEPLVEYAAVHLEGAWTYLGYAGWGAACGQFSTMLHQKFKDFLQAQQVQTTA